MNIRLAVCGLFILTNMSGQADPLTNGVPLGETLTFSLRTVTDWHPKLQFGSDELIVSVTPETFLTEQLRRIS